ncbi:MAG: serine/threonine-protein kinase [Polyangiaceae bacterium]
MVDPALLRDRVLAGRYRLDERLGAGGMGSIWRAQHLVLAAPVAVKLIDREAVPDEETLARFMREAQSAATLRSPHVVQILDYGVDDQLPFIVMELLDGENLAQRIRRLERLPSADTARIVTHIGRAVGRAHEAGIVHRDLKPENVFLIRNEDEEIAKVLDFGVAKVATAALGAEGTRTRTGSILGTPYYMSPEQAQGNKTVDTRSDLWSLGVIAFECLTGKRPFYSDGLGDLVLQICIRDIPIPSEVASVPIGFDAWFAKACAREPEARFQSARELTDALREVLGGETREVLGETREVQWTSPEVPSLASDEAPNSQARTRMDAQKDPGAATLSESSARVRSTSGSMPDQHAATLAAASEGPPSSRHGSNPSNSRPLGSSPNSSRSGSSPNSSRGPISSRGAAANSMRADSAVIAEMLLNAESAPPPKRSGAALVFWVAATALAIGLGAGLLFMKRNDPHLRPLPKAAPPAHEVASAHVHTKATEHSASAHEELAPTATASAKPTASGQPKLQIGASAKAAPSASDTAPTTAVDGGWVKPAWAIPDEEPRRVHDDDARDAGK